MLLSTVLCLQCDTFRTGFVTFSNDRIWYVNYQARFHRFAVQEFDRLNRIFVRLVRI